jgi:hypothetical protein
MDRKKSELYKTFSVIDGEFMTTMKWKRNSKELAKKYFQLGGY